MRLFLTLFLVALLPLPAQAALETLFPSADTFVSQAHPTSNYGDGGALSVSASALPKGEFISLLRFNTAQTVASLNATFGAGQWTVQNVTLQFSASPPNNPIFNGNGAGPGGSNINLAGQFKISWMLQDNWVEGTGKPNLPTADGVTYNTLPSFLTASDRALGTFAFDGSGSDADNRSLTLDGAFLTDLMAGGDVSLLVQPQGSAVAYNFNSHDFREADSEDNVPLLFITAVPEPGAAGLLVGALLAGAARRHRPRHARRT